ncbi:hypothetical protein EDD16DRAFT_1514904 [Pisolithus croceorrhizus]|nr:hypothetical protein EDD16DRAFT_1514904 [Pisolithus croceorrhizus]KAI6160042.1 hypothetical protein EDD17DRAFT_1510778 [Pisolithus thermaeus]
MSSWVLATYKRLIRLGSTGIPDGAGFEAIQARCNRNGTTTYMGQQLRASEADWVCPHPHAIGHCGRYLSAATAVSPTTPPTTPPAIAPALLDFEALRNEVSDEEGLGDGVREAARSVEVEMLEAVTCALVAVDSGLSEES